jgi:hypothetical protein
MKKTILVLLVFYTGCSLAQSLTNSDSIKLESTWDCKAAERYALEASNYLFSKPFEENDVHRLKALQFIIKWMAATPDYKFTMDEVAEKLVKGSDNLLGLYMGAMTKYVLETKNASKDNAVIKLNAITTLLNYSENPSNKIKMTRNLRKLSDARAKGQLEQALQ